MTYHQVLQLVLACCALALVYVYALFPIAMSVIGNRAGKRERQPSGNGSESSSELPSVTLVIPAHNEQSVIESKLDNSLKLEYPDQLLRIIVACDGVDDATADLAKAYESERIRVLAFPVRRGKASVISDAVADANTELVCLCDANVMFAPDALLRMVKHFIQKDVGAVSGDVRLDSEKSSFGAAESLYYRIERSIHRGESRIGSMMGVDGGMYVIRRELFESLDENTILDDFTVSMGVIRSGKRIVYEPAAIATESATEAATTEFNRRVRLSTGAAQIVLRRQFPSISQPVELLTFISHKLLRWLSPFIILIAIAALSVLAISDGYYRAIASLLFVIGILSIIGAVSVTLRRLTLFAVPFYFSMSQIAMAYGTCKGVFGHPNARWQRTAREVNNVSPE
ncbi:Poly-beta-1,6-N-acetyl-D-glucosamine synthase [Stieleria maiorica]|uniref:Poly-beta-1,6-N-acetyl-D-glucosamine synthase n=1 Tax=Stieleria maiorica TaxID=2795974 RepID=A0A5B9MJ31_9BACT|nr:glycosyltransferase family 2 protein [Stieleria maiorica]QEF99654.1 Poly-beta-1,6-N-acetyl-D-glucosamine synthase [Stieleria maiorica]